MSTKELIAIITTIVGVVLFSIVFTILYKSLVKEEISEIEAGENDVELIEEIIHVNNKGGKIFGYIKLGIFCLFLMILVSLAGYGVISRISGDLPMINGKAVMTVASGSMSKRNTANDYLDTEELYNQFPTYSIIVLEEVFSEDDLKPYDVIAFVNDKGINVIHRIRKIVEDENGVTHYITRGDSNNEDDAYHPCFDDVVGKYNDKYIPLVGLFVMFFQSYPGMITIVGVVYIVFMMDKRSKDKNEALDKRAKLIAQNISCYNDSLNLGEFEEIIYYKEFIYYFNQEGFVKKESLLEGMPYYDSVNDRMIKVFKGKDSQEICSVVLLNERKGDM